PPAWLKASPDQIAEQICKLARKGASPSQIGVVLRDAHGVSQVKTITGMSNRRRQPVIGGQRCTNYCFSPIQVTRFSVSSSLTVRSFRHEISTKRIDPRFEIYHASLQ